MESEKLMKARKNEVGYCGEYCRTCHWYTDALRKPAVQLSELVKKHFEVAGWINYKGGNSEQTIKGLEILSKCACAFNCKGGGGWSGCPVRKCCLAKGVDFCFEWRMVRLEDGSYGGWNYLYRDTTGQFEKTTPSIYWLIDFSGIFK